MGGFSLGLERTGGFETVAFWEIEEFPRNVLKKHWPDVTCYHDIRELTGERVLQDVRTIDVITGGYPCQPFSHAGKREGQADDRHIWPEISRLLDEIRPNWFIGENVAGHVSMGLDDVLFDLESKAYTCQAFIIPACALYASHRRDRVWIMANAKGVQRNGEQDNEKQSERQESQFGSGGCKTDVANTKCIRLQGSGEFVQSLYSEKVTNRKAIEFINGCERREWQSKSKVGRVANGVPRSLDRLKSLGNAVVPQIPEMLGYAILEAERENK